MSSRVADKRWWVGLILALDIAAQASPAAPAATAQSVELTVVGGTQLNPNAQGRSSPVVVRIFALSSAKLFESADYATLFEHEGDPLKHDVIEQEEFVLRPGDIQRHDRELPPQVTLLGIAAAFRDIDHAVWHLTVPLHPDRRNFILIDLDQDTIRLVPVDPRP